MKRQARALWSHGGLQWIGLVSGVGEAAGSLLLASNGLPQMQGSDLMRDLREAMSLGTA